MKKGLFLILAILTLGISHVSADIAAPILEDKYIRVEVREGADFDKVKESVEKVDGVFSTQTVEKGQSEVCKPCEKCDAKATPGETLSEKDIKSLKMATLIIYITLGILVVLMIIVIALMVARRKKDSKKDA